MSARSPASTCCSTISSERIEGLATINGNLARQVTRQRITDEERHAALKRISPAQTLNDLGDCDLVIEAATEKEEVKRKIFAALCPASRPTRSSAPTPRPFRSRGLPPSTDRPERFIGIHFMNPVPLMELVEIIRGIATDDQTFETTKRIRRQARQDRSPSPRIFPLSSSTASCCR